jgi:hypothetical protein
MNHDAPPFDAIDHALNGNGPAAALDELIRTLSASGEARPLLDALLLKARHELGLPAIAPASLAGLPEPKRTQYEDRYVEAIRQVGSRLLNQGEIPAAWPYFRAIAEPEPIAEAIEAFEPSTGDERLGQVIEVAFNQGANPRRGFELILDHYGACSAISAFEALPTDDATRTRCAARLIGHLHAQVLASLRGDIARRDLPAPPEGSTVKEVIAAHPWLFEDEAYHIDVSHLAAGVRIAPILDDPAPIALAIELTDYGRNLSPRHRFEGDPPFEDLYEDHAVYLRALLGQEVDAAIAHFRAKLPASEPSNDRDPMPAQILVRLLVRLDRLEEAIALASEHLAGMPEGALICPSLPQLCARAGRPDLLARAAREQGDLVHYLAARLHE